MSAKMTLFQALQISFPEKKIYRAFKFATNSSDWQKWEGFIITLNMTQFQQVKVQGDTSNTVQSINSSRTRDKNS